MKLLSLKKTVTSMITKISLVDTHVQLKHEVKFHIFNLFQVISLKYV
jgi:hypothetical protein